MSETAIFGAGCFWGVEEAFRHIPGVDAVTSGYSGGHAEHPTYPQVCTGDTGHAEVVEVRFDPQRVSYDRLLQVFFSIHDPTQVNRQGPDVGTQYRTVIFTLSEAQATTAQAAKQRIDDGGFFPKPLATQILPAGPFWPAEDYHQRYLEKNGGQCHI